MTLSEATPIEGTTFSDLTANATVETLGGAKTILSFLVDNTANSVDVYFKVWEGTSPTVGTDNPDFIFRIPAAEKRFIPIGSRASGFLTTTGSFFACVTEPGTGGTTSPTNPVKVTVKTL